MPVRSCAAARRVDGFAPANRAVAHALSLVAGRPDAEIILVNVQKLETLDTWDISAAITVEAPVGRTAIPHRAAPGGGAVPQGFSPSYDGHRDRLPREDHRPNRARDPCQSDCGGYARSRQPGNLLVAARVIKLSELPITLVKLGSWTDHGGDRSFSSCCSSSP
jgi:hypothetical protein